MRYQSYEEWRDETAEFLIEQQFEDNENPAFGSNGLAPVPYKDKYGYIDTTGGWVIEPKLTEAHFI